MDFIAQKEVLCQSTVHSRPKVQLFCQCKSRIVLVVNLDICVFNDKEMPLHVQLVITVHREDKIFTTH
jgi:hypothetical protein